MNNTLLMILGMALVTYLPRSIPFAVVSGKKLPIKLERFLSYIPYAALGALIIPGAFSAIPGSWMVSSVGVGFAFLCARYKGGIILPVLGAIIVSFFMLLVKDGMFL